MKNALVGLCFLIGALLGLGRADDFPPVRNFGPFSRFAGGNWPAQQARIRYSSGPLGEETVGKAVGVLREEKSWFSQRILLELLRAMKKKARGADPFPGEPAKRLAGDKEKRDYIEKVLKPIRG